MGKVILTVDDSASVRQMVRFTLSDAGYTIVEATDGQDALQKLTQPVQLVITDLNMPRLDGIGLIRKLEGKAAGATGWVVKPFTMQQILAVVKRMVG